VLKLKKLRIRGIGRFLEEQVIDFESLGSFVQLDGQNNNTKGSSGAGKSTVFHALDHLLGISNKPSTVLKCRYSEDVPFVEGEFDHDGKPLIISRHKKLRIEYHDGKVVTGSSALTEAELDTILAIPRAIFRPMMHKRQKEGGFFLNMGPSDLFIFLMDCLGLSKYRLKLEILDKKLKDLEEKKTSTKSSLDSAQASLKATNEAFLSLGTAPVKEVTQEIILELKTKSDKSSSELSAVQARHRLESETLELSRPKSIFDTFNRDRLNALESRLTDLVRSQEQMVAVEKERQSQAKLNRVRLENTLSDDKRVLEQANLAGARIKEISEQLKLIRDGKCFNCGQTWQDATKEAKLKEEALKCHHMVKAGVCAAQRIPQIEAQIKGLDGEIKPREPEGLQEVVKEIASVTERVNGLKEEERNHNAAQTSKAMELQSDFTQKHLALTTRHSTELTQVKGQSEIDRRALDAAVGRLRAYEESRTRYEASVASLKDRSKIHADKVAELEAQTKSIDEELFKAEELKRGVKSHLSCSFDDALETISKSATDLIRHIPNMANATIQIEGEKETQDGKVKEEVNAVIHMDGDENIDIRSLCGGERTALDLAIDLSVIDLIETEANKGIDIFILDEPFQGLDTVCIEEALQVLKNAKASKRLVIVDHNPEVKQMVESRLTVMRDGATSRVIQAARRFDV
jgi:DNA repair exonuclease SbcCD ATPase subunit